MREQVWAEMQGITRGHTTTPCLPTHHPYAVAHIITRTHAPYHGTAAP